MTQPEGGRQGFGAGVVVPAGEILPPGVPEPLVRLDRDPLIPAEIPDSGDRHRELLSQKIGRALLGHRAERN